MEELRMDPGMLLAAPGAPTLTAVPVPGLGITQLAFQGAKEALQGGQGEVLRAGLWEDDENAATFYLDSGDGNAATVIYDYRNLLVSYRARLHHACYVTRVDQDNIPGLDSVVETFQRRQAEDKIAMPLADRSMLGTTAGILCSLLPVYWA
nr:pulmonary surfactant-associated protein C [Zonotrichia albicollis]